MPIAGIKTQTIPRRDKFEQGSIERKLKCYKMFKLKIIWKYKDD